MNMFSVPLNINVTIVLYGSFRTCWIIIFKFKLTGHLTKLTQLVLTLKKFKNKRDILIGYILRQSNY